ncbi:carboxymuconolactone decarboxylase family protein [Flavihumibacter petaseus]|uniref:Carboxymuconolactone decarboxylase-like domain-containing protein n=1 Tax=Flavihumibacter petaseus NBRC 106054 TaxID=1220578 RepID=A0A0E9N3W6_9BACT|nr:hypothetical protein [Flavihumibacter petaseus]GAO44677.1 hypothetical protein FPE01S_03_07160 [Flavihumibacter petaseus NBRC 106054]
MRIKPIPPEQLNEELRNVHEAIANLTGHRQSQVKMTDEHGALLGPFAPMLHYPQFGIPALSFLRAIDAQATLDRRVREVVILTVGAAFDARFELYAHQITGAAVGLAAGTIATLAAGGHPQELNEQEHIAHIITNALVRGHTIHDSTYNQATAILGKDGVAELFFLVAGYCLIAVILNGFDMPAPELPA